MTQIAPEPVWVVEDSDEDYEALARTIRGVSEDIKVYRCSTGDELLERLSRDSNSSSTNEHRSTIAVPSVILLDLNLPGTDGREVLSRIKTQGAYQTIPVVILTTSNNPKDIQFCYENGANGYLVKPMDISRLRQMMDAFTRYWLDANKPPPSTMQILN